jgi:glutamate synthase (NADPH/NADH) large chain
LRKRFTGNADHVVNLFKFLTRELREIMAELGFRTIAEMVGQVECLEVTGIHKHWKTKKINLSPILYKEPTSMYTGIYHMEDQDHGLTEVLDWKLLEAARPAIESGQKITAAFKVKNTDRTIGTILSNEISKIFKSKGLPADSIHFKLTGTAGQSFGAFNTHGVTLELEGDANDYFGKGLSGARLIVYPAHDAGFVPEENFIIGNVAFYGATSGEAFIRGKAGERFAVRNSGANAVVEGIGDHGCEYMTGGRVVILGSTGRNFAAGMSGGIAYVYNVDGKFSSLCNPDMIDLDPLDEDDIIEMKEMISRHYEYTGSTVAKFVMDDFENQLRNFVKVFPKDFKKVLSEKKARVSVNS